jgi:hypothetical protein
MPTWISSNELNSLPARLRGLRDYDPPAGGWQRLQRRTRARRIQAYAGGGLALAASLLLGIGLSLGIGVKQPAAVPVIEPAQQTASNADINRLISTSQLLEQRLARVRPQVAVWDSSREARADELEQRVQAVDAQLNYYASDPRSAETLWRNRVELMNALVDLHKPQPREPAWQYASYQY